VVDKGDRWSKKETRKLKSNWPDHTAEEIADMLPGRTKEAVESKAQRLEDKGELPDKNRSRSRSSSTNSTSKEQVQKGGSQVRFVSGTITDVKRDTPRGMKASNGIGMKIDGEWYYDTYSPSWFEDSIHGVAFSQRGFTVKGAHVSGADYTVERSGRSSSYRRLQSYGTIRQNEATRVVQSDDWRELKAGVNAEMMWKHEDTGEGVAARGLSNGNYKLTTPKYEPQYYGRRKRVREEAIEYMEENPEGADSTYEERSKKGPSKQDRVRASGGR